MFPANVDKIETAWVVTRNHQSVKKVTRLVLKQGSEHDPKHDMFMRDTNPDEWYFRNNLHGTEAGAWKAVMQHAEYQHARAAKAEAKWRSTWERARDKRRAAQARDGL